MKLVVYIFFMLDSSSEIENKEHQDVHTRKKIRDDKDYIFFHLDFIVPDKWIFDMLGGPKQLATQTPTERPGAVRMEWYIPHPFTENLPVPQRIEELK